MKRGDATMIKRYAAIRGLRARVLKRRWLDASPSTRNALRRDIHRFFAQHDQKQADKAAAAAFARLASPPPTSP